MTELSAEMHGFYQRRADNELNLMFDTELADQVVRMQPTHLLYFRCVNDVIDEHQDMLLALSVYDAATQELVMPTMLYDPQDYFIDDESVDGMLLTMTNLMDHMFSKASLLAIIDCPEFHAQHRQYHFLEPAASRREETCASAPSKHLH